MVLTRSNRDIGPEDDNKKEGDIQHGKRSIYIAQNFKETLTEGYSEVITYTNLTRSKKKQEKDDDKEKLLYSTRLQMIQASNMIPSTISVA